MCVRGCGVHRTIGRYGRVTQAAGACTGVCIEQRSQRRYCVFHYGHAATAPRSAHACAATRMIHALCLCSLPFVSIYCSVIFILHLLSFVYANVFRLRPNSLTPSRLRVRCTKWPALAYAHRAGTTICCQSIRSGVC